VSQADDARLGDVEAATKIADRLDALADTADLMGDEATARRLHARAMRARLDAMGPLDRA
jgi:hypothetical protein